MLEKRTYTLLITKGNDPDGQYDFYKERIDSQNDFSYTEYNTEDNDLTDEVFEEADVIVMLFGLYHSNQELHTALLMQSKPLSRAMTGKSHVPAQKNLKPLLTSPFKKIADSGKA